MFPKIMPTISNYKNSNIIYNKIAASINTFILNVSHVVSWRIHIIYKIFLNPISCSVLRSVKSILCLFYQKNIKLIIEFCCSEMIFITA